MPWSWYLFTAIKHWLRQTVRMSIKVIRNYTIKLPIIYVNKHTQSNWHMHTHTNEGQTDRQIDDRYREREMGLFKWKFSTWSNNAPSAMDNQQKFNCSVFLFCFGFYFVNLCTWPKLLCGNGYGGLHPHTGNSSGL